MNNYPPHVGGVERHVASLAEHLVERGHRATVVTLGGPPRDEIVNGVRVIRLRSWLPVGEVLSFPLPGATSRILLLLRGQGVTAVSTHTRFFPMTAVGVRVARALGVPLVHTEHGSDYVRGVNPLVAAASRVVDRTAGRHALRRARVVLAVSERVAEFVGRLASVDARVFYNAVDLEVWSAAARPPRKRLVFVGRLVPGKGWQDLLEAAEIVRHRAGPDLEVGVYGAGPDADELRQAIAERGLGDLVEVHGEVGREELGIGVAGAVLVNPTRLAEGFQTSIIEVLAAGGRVVTYDVPGAGVLAENGAPVWIVPRSVEALAEAILAEIVTPSAPYAGAHLARWGWGPRAEEYAAILAEVGGGGKPPA